MFTTTIRSTESDRRLHGTALVTLVLLPIVLLVLNRHWTCNLLYRDHWIYFSYYQHLPELLAQFPQSYFGTRLSVILPGWLAYRVLPPQAANDVLHVTMAITALVSLYLALRDTLGTRTALLSSVFLGCHWYFLCTVGGDYVDGYGVVYICLSLLTLTRAARASQTLPRLCWLLAGGMALAALAIANLVYLAVVLMLLANYWLLTRADSVRSWSGYGMDAATILAGAVCLVAALGLINRQFGGRFLFMMPSFNFGNDFVRRAAGESPFKAPFTEWAPHATWMLLPMLALMGSFWRLGSKIRQQPWHWQGLVRSCHYQMIFLPLALGLIALDFQPRFCMLQMWFYATPLLMILAVTALAQQWSEVVEGMTSRDYGLLLISGAGLMILSAIWRTGINTSPLSPPLALTAGLLVLCSLAATQWAPQPRAAFVYAVLLAATNLWMRHSFQVDHSLPALSTNLELSKSHLLHPIRRDCFAAANDVLDEIHRHKLNQPACHFWYDIHEPFGVLFDDLACTHLARTIVNVDFPHHTREQLVDKTIAVLSSRPQPRERLESHVQDVGLNVEVISERFVHQRAVRFHLTLAKFTAP